MGPRTRGLLSGVLLLANVCAACTSWRVQSVTPEELLARDPPSSIQVREHSGTVYTLASPHIEGDSLAGYVKFVPRRISMLVVDKVAIREFNTLKTAWWAVGFPILAVGALVGLACVGGGCNMNFGSWSYSP